jgi:hypothetical protein
LSEVRGDRIVPLAVGVVPRSHILAFDCHASASFDARPPDCDMDVFAPLRA